MVIHLTGSSRQSGDDLPFLRASIKTINAQGHEIANNWVETANLTMAKHDIDWDWRDKVADIRAALERADAIIIEATSYAFLQGYQAAIALEARKPVLLLSRKPLEDKAVSGITDELLVLAEYSSESELNKAISDFLHDLKGMELALKLGVQEQNILRAKAYESGETIESTLRKLIIAAN